MLAGRISTESVIYGIARGGVVVGGVAARELGCRLDVIVARKIGAPYNPELAVAAVSEFGDVAVEEEVARLYGISRDEIMRRAELEVPELRRRGEEYRGGRKILTPGGGLAIVVDDGLATGTTMLASILSVRRMGPSRLIAAAPVASAQAASRLENSVDELVCPYILEDFYAVGEFYEDFSQVSDDEVSSYLRAGEVRG